MNVPRANTAENAVKLVSEAFVPGASLLLDGKISTVGAHMLVGAWAAAALGPVGLVLVIANSYTTSVTGKSLREQFSKADGHAGTRVEAHLAN